MKRPLHSTISERLFLSAGEGNQIRGYPFRMRGYNIGIIHTTILLHQNPTIRYRPAVLPCFALWLLRKQWGSCAYVLVQRKLSRVSKANPWETHFLTRLGKKPRRFMPVLYPRSKFHSYTAGRSHLRY